MTTFNTIKAKPSLRDVLDLFRQEIFLAFNCHAIATVRSVNTSIGPTHPRQTITAQMNYSKTYVKTAANGAVTTSQVEYPILIDCPFIVIGGGGARLNSPIVEGDQCFIFFNDRDIDNWFSGAFSGPVATNRSHSLADGIALVGLNVAEDFDQDHLSLTWGDTKIGVGENKVIIENTLTSLKTIMTHLSAALKIFATATSAAAVEPTLGPASTTLGLAFTLAVTGIDALIGDLFE